MMESYETSLMRRLLITTTCWVVDRHRPRLAPLGHLVHLADSALGRWFQEIMSNQFKPDQTSFGLSLSLSLSLCVCVCVCVSIYVLGEDLMSAACMSVKVRLCFAWSCVCFV